MGWKAVKDHYRIDHIVQVVEGKGICIGSAYVHDLIAISPTGKIMLSSIFRPQGDLGRYVEEMEADPALLRALIAQPDTFTASLQVFTYERARIIEWACEELGWPNVMHDGRMMFENTFSPDRDQVVKWAIKSAEARAEAWAENAEHRQREADDAAAERDAARINLDTLRTRELAHVE